MPQITNFAVFSPSLKSLHKAYMPVYKSSRFLARTGGQMDSIEGSTRGLHGVSWGPGDNTKTDEFSKKFQTAFVPLLIFGKSCCNFFRKS